MSLEELLQRVQFALKTGSSESNQFSDIDLEIYVDKRISGEDAKTLWQHTKNYYGQQDLEMYFRLAEDLGTNPLGWKLRVDEEGNLSEFNGASEEIEYSNTVARFHSLLTADVIPREKFAQITSAPTSSIVNYDEDIDVQSHLRDFTITKRGAEMWTQMNIHKFITENEKPIYEMTGNGSRLRFEDVMHARAKAVLRTNWGLYLITKMGGSDSMQMSELDNLDFIIDYRGRPDIAYSSVCRADPVFGKIINEKGIKDATRTAEEVRLLQQYPTRIEEGQFRQNAMSFFREVYRWLPGYLDKESTFYHALFLKTAPTQQQQ